MEEEENARLAYEEHYRENVLTLYDMYKALVPEEVKPNYPFWSWMIYERFDSLSESIEAMFETEEEDYEAVEYEEADK